MLLGFIKELTNQILLPGFSADSAFSSELWCVHADFASFLADSEGEKQDDGFLGLGEGPYCLPIAK